MSQILRGISISSIVRNSIPCGLLCLIFMGGFFSRADDDQNLFLAPKSQFRQPQAVQTLDFDGSRLFQVISGFFDLYVTNNPAFRALWSKSRKRSITSQIKERNLVVSLPIEQEDNPLSFFLEIIEKGNLSDSFTFKDLVSDNLQAISKDNDLKQRVFNFLLNQMAPDLKGSNRTIQKTDEKINRSIQAIDALLFLDRESIFGDLLLGDISIWQIITDLPESYKRTQTALVAAHTDQVLESLTLRESLLFLQLVHKVTLESNNRTNSTRSFYSSIMIDPQISLEEMKEFLSRGFVRIDQKDAPLVIHSDPSSIGNIFSISKPENEIGENTWSGAASEILVAEKLNTQVIQASREVESPWTKKKIGSLQVKNADTGELDLFDVVGEISVYQTHGSIELYPQDSRDFNDIAAYLHFSIGENDKGKVLNAHTSKWASIDERTSEFLKQAPDFVSNQFSGENHGLAISPTYRGQGVGSFLLGIATDIPDIKSVRITQPTGTTIYENFGISTASKNSQGHRVLTGEIESVFRSPGYARFLEKKSQNFESETAIVPWILNSYLSLDRSLKNRIITEKAA